MNTLMTKNEPIIQSYEEIGNTLRFFVKKQDYDLNPILYSEHIDDKFNHLNPLKIFEETWWKENKELFREDVTSLQVWQSLPLYHDENYYNIVGAICKYMFLQSCIPYSIMRLRQNQTLRIVEIVQYKNSLKDYDDNEDDYDKEILLTITSMYEFENDDSFWIENLMKELPKEQSIEAIDPNLVNKDKWYSCLFIKWFSLENIDFIPKLKSVQAIIESMEKKILTNNDDSIYCYRKKQKLDFLSDVKVFENPKESKITRFYVCIIEDNIQIILPEEIFKKYYSIQETLRKTITITRKENFRLQNIPLWVLLKQ